MPPKEASVCEESQFDRLFLEQAEGLRNFCYYQCKDLDEAEDYVQEAFVRLWKNCAKVPLGSARAFLFKVAKNLFLHKVEHQQVVMKFIRRQPSPIEHQGPHYHMEEQELKARLEDALSRLSEKQRTVFLLHRMDGKSYKEIAELLGISVKSVEKRMHRALLSLRTCIPQL